MEAEATAETLVCEAHEGTVQTADIVDVDMHPIVLEAGSMAREDTVVDRDTRMVRIVLLV